MTMLTFPTMAPSSCGIVETDLRGVLTALHHKVTDPPGDIANAATYVFTPGLVEEVLAAPEVWDFSAQTLPQLVGRAMTHHTEMLFVDIGTITAYLQAATDCDAWVGQAGRP
jgi:mannose-1-phosphate guanylyltransferase